MARYLRIVTWNIAEKNDQIDEIVHQISRSNPDIVLLNEVRILSPIDILGPGGVHNPVETIADRLKLDSKYGITTNLGAFGRTKGVAILSKFSLTEVKMHLHHGNLPLGNWGTLEASASIDGVRHRIFSTRLSRYVRDDTTTPSNIEDRKRNIEGHQDLMRILRETNGGDHLILGGDFNAMPDAPQTLEFDQGARQIGLVDVTRGRPVFGPEIGIDRIYARSPYMLRDVHLSHEWTPGTDPSDHSWIFVELRASRRSNHAPINALIL
jgi:endonuclease/exonuclease/phosphatase family metal-dependent hydrolase